MRKPFSPAASMSRPAESPAGLVNTEPALDPPGWCSRRHLTMALTAACSSSTEPGLTASSAATTTWVAATEEEPIAVGEAGDVVGARRRR